MRAVTRALGLATGLGVALSWSAGPRAEELAYAKVEPQSQIEALTQRLSDNEIARIDFLKVPQRAAVKTRLTPELLESSFYYKLEFHDIRQSAYKTEFLRAAKSVSAVPESGTPDLRSALIFYDASDTRVAAIYFDRSGSRGIVNGLPVVIHGKLYRWLDDNFGDFLR